MAEATPQLAITKQAPLFGVVNEDFTFTITVTNVGTSEATNVIVEDELALILLYNSRFVLVVDICRVLLYAHGQLVAWSFWRTTA